MEIRRLLEKTEGRTQREISEQGSNSNISQNWRTWDYRLRGFSNSPSQYGWKRPVINPITMKRRRKKSQKASSEGEREKKKKNNNKKLVMYKGLRSRLAFTFSKMKLKLAGKEEAMPWKFYFLLKNLNPAKLSLNIREVSNLSDMQGLSFLHVHPFLRSY